MELDLHTINWAMQRKPLRIIIPFLLVVVFIGFGDRFLPEPFKSASTNPRKTIIRVFMGLVPENWQPAVDPNERAEEALDKLDEEERKNKEK